MSTTTFARPARPPAWARAGLALIGAAVVVWSARTLMVGVAGTGWHDVVVLLRPLSHLRLVVLVVVWLGGLGVYAATVLAAALPGLGVGRSLLLNLSGSAVANVLPLGGAVATGLNWRMVRSWGHSNGSFSAFCVLTNGLDVLTKLVLPVAAVVTLLVAGQHVPTSVWALALTCAVALAAAAWTALGVGRIRSRVGHRVADLLATTLDLVRQRPLPLVLGSTCYLATQVLLLRLCLGACGLQPTVAVLLTCAALERLATLVPVTPAGVGLAELGAVAWLVASGLDPAASVAGVLLYRVFIVGLEVPVGAVLLAGWSLCRRRAHREAR